MQITGNTAAFSVYQPVQSPQGRQPVRAASSSENQSVAGDPDATARITQSTAPPTILTEKTDGEGLTEEEQKIVQELQQRDQEVRAHEQAHKNVAGPYAGPISYDTVTGPDGRQYAVGGSVQIDTSPIPNNPRATIQKLETVIRAALAPADPSPEDFAVARAAQSALQQARNELRQQETAEREENSESNNPLNQSAIEAYKQANDLSSNTENNQNSAQEIAQVLFTQA